MANMVLNRIQEDGYKVGRDGRASSLGVARTPGPHEPNDSKNCRHCREWAGTGQLLAITVMLTGLMHNVIKV